MQKWMWSVLRCELTGGLSAVEQLQQKARGGDAAATTGGVNPMMMGVNPMMMMAQAMMSQVL